KRVYFWSIFLWSLFTMLQGGVFIFKGMSLAGIVSLSVFSLFALRFIVGLMESPAFPGNGRLVSSWFPTRERGTASAVFNSAQYFATAIFAPILGWFTSSHGWHTSFLFMGIIGIIISLIWLRIIYEPSKHPSLSKNELDFISEGGALIHLGRENEIKLKDEAPVNKVTVRMLLSQRMLVGVYLAQYSITTLTWFFISWFPVYLIKERHMTVLGAGFAASLPALCGFMGGVLGGIFSDVLLKKGYTLSVARKVPIIIGMLCSMLMVACNYVDSVGVVIFLMSLSFFGKGLGALGWAVVSDTSPKEAIGLSGGLFNTIGNVAGIITPIVIGYIINATGSFQWALVYVSFFALLTIF
ncbi:MFS transporter, partial [Klebsiella pneumoniae]